MSSQARTVVTAPEARVAVDTHTTRNPRLFRGLCINCDDRFTCTFRCPEGGVWYCEEYR